MTRARPIPSTANSRPHRSARRASTPRSPRPSRSRPSWQISRRRSPHRALTHHPSSAAAAAPCRRCPRSAPAPTRVLATWVVRAAAAMATERSMWIWTLLMRPLPRRPTRVAVCRRARPSRLNGWSRSRANQMVILLLYFFETKKKKNSWNQASKQKMVD